MLSFIEYSIRVGLVYWVRLAYIKFLKYTSTRIVKQKVFFFSLKLNLSAYNICTSAEIKQNWKKSFYAKKRKISFWASARLENGKTKNWPLFTFSKEVFEKAVSTWMPNTIFTRLGFLLNRLNNFECRSVKLLISS